MALPTVFILTRQVTERGQTRHTSIMHFLDLIDACGFDVKLGRTLPELDELTFYKLIFIDVNICPFDELFQSELLASLYKNRIVLIGIKNDDVEIENTKYETTALKMGARGAFYENDKLENIVKGIQQIKNGKFWFKRDIVESVLQDLLVDLPYNKTKEIISLQSNIVLTKREYMIMVLIGQGAQNKEIADQLHISVNTVKTHVYSIFRKTNCRNRVELIQWSMQKLKEVS
jgi:DNA-binding NarL/FixJ family response regulator